MGLYDDAQELARRHVDGAVAQLESQIADLEADLQATVEGRAADTRAHEDQVSQLRAEITRLEARIRELEAPPVTATPGLFFKRDDAAEKASAKKVFAHFFGPYPLTWSNKAPGQDIYETTYLPVQGEGGKHAAYGGFLRDRPISNAPYAGDWMRAQMAEEIANAVRYSIDGFYIDMLGLSGANWDRYVALADEASANFPGFYVVPMVDTNGATGAAPIADAARAVNVFLSKPSAYRLPDGRYVVGSFKAEGKTNQWWTDLANAIKTNHGKTVAYTHVFLNSGSASGYTQYASGSWGPGGDPAVWPTYTGTTAGSRSRGEKVLAPVWSQDERPRNGWFDEALNTSSLRASWDRAIADNADLVQMCTWSDYSESQMNPSVMRGTAALEISAYRIAEWKLGTKPEILQDNIIVSHRNQMLSATITGGQSQLMTQNQTRIKRSAVREHVEVLTYFVKPQKVTVKIGSDTYNYDAPAGENVWTAPMKPGTVSVSTSAGHTLTSPVVIRSASGNQDRAYAMCSLLGPTDRQYDPTPKA